ncbi:MAG: hypothetical protein ABSB76_25735 [Streptosporangiaceae bacterium]
MPWRLRHPRRLTVLAIATEAPNAVYSALRAARAVQRRGPRTSKWRPDSEVEAASPAALWAGVARKA